MQSVMDRKKLFVELQDQMVQGRFKPDVRLGQNFCVNEAVIAAVMKAAKVKKGERVLEIGPGTGFLTRELLEKKALVTAVEKSDVLFEGLSAETVRAGLSLVHADFLEFPEGSFDAVVAFPPYYIASEIMLRLLTEFSVSRMVLVWQAEFAEKLIAFPGFPAYGPLSVLAHCQGVSSAVQKVPKSAFFPVPKSDSVVWSFVKKNRYGPINRPRDFVLFLKHLFRFSNKNLANSGKLAFPFLEKDLKLREKAFLRAIERSGLSDEKVDLIEAGEYLGLFDAVQEK